MLLAASWPFPPPASAGTPERHLPLRLRNTSQSLRLLVLLLCQAPNYPCGIFLLDCACPACYNLRYKEVRKWLILKNRPGPLPGIAVRLKELRTSKSLSQTEFAAKFGVAQNAYSRYETGSVPLPLVALDNLCKTYNVRREWLETGEGSMY